jgi:hypothetical protein
MMTTETEIKTFEVTKVPGWHLFLYLLRNEQDSTSYQRHFAAP